MKQFTSPFRSPSALAALVAAAFTVGTLQTTVARADVYHVVVQGDTLASVAKRYDVTPAALSALNRMEERDFDAALPGMLLRVPDGHQSAATAAAPGDQSAPTAAATDTTVAIAHSTGLRGTISRALAYTVQQGDSWDSIAARHAAAGYTVTADQLQSANGGGATPTVGQTVRVPLESTRYRAASTPSLRTVSSGTPSAVEGAAVSAEMPASTWRPDGPGVPVAQVIAQGESVYKTPQPRAASHRTRAVEVSTRGPVELASRSAMGSPTLDGVRVLSSLDDAPSEGKVPQPRLRTMSPSHTKSAPRRVAHVAKIASNNARIRRLPDAGAATLYHCASGTEIAVIKRSGNWSAILMSDRSTGWVPTHYLKLTGRDVDISSQVIADNSNIPAGQGFSIRGHFSSSNPMVAQALTWLGTPYVYGGESRRGVDCSSLVQHAFAACGYHLPRTAAEQARVGQPVSPSQLRAGDRLYFSASGSRIDHTGLYMGDGYFVQASGRGRGVIVSRLADRRNWNIYVGARR